MLSFRIKSGKSVGLLIHVLSNVKCISIAMSVFWNYVCAEAPKLLCKIQFCIFKP